MATNNTKPKTKRPYKGRKKMELADDPNHHPKTKREETFLNLKHKKITVKPGEWYNLQTSRRVKKMTDRTYFISPRVAGNVAMLQQFMLLNDLSPKQIQIPVHLTNLNDELLAASDKKPRVIAATNIDHVSKADLDQLQPFSFTNIKVKALITNIIDGDTFDCAFIMNPAQWALPTAIRIDNKTTIGQLTTICTINKVIGDRMVKGECPLQTLIKLRIRLFDCDAADKDSPRKEAATDFVQRWAKRSGNRIWLQLMGYDCRSRILGKLYQRGNNDRQSKCDLTSRLLEYRHPTLGAVAVPYDGGNKTAAWGGKKIT